MTDFPVVWDDPADAQRTWRLDRLHHPGPITPLDYWFFSDVIAPTIEAVWPVYGRPTRWITRRINTYLYSSVSQEPPSEDGRERLLAASLRVRELWTDEVLPRVEDNLRWWASYDLGVATLEELQGHLRETIGRARHTWFLHHLVDAPAFQPIVDLADLYTGTCGGTDLDAFRLVQGFDNKTLQTGRELWRLGRAAAASSEIAAALERDDAAAALNASPAGREWLAEFESFLAVYGQRADDFGLSGPAWIEDPSPALDAVRRFMSRDEDPSVELEKRAAEREGAVAEARECFATAPDDARERFELLLGAAQAGNVITEDHGFFIDFATGYRIRQVFLELGRRFVQGGWLADAGDVVMLGADEVLETAGDRRELVGERREEMERFRFVHPPEILGAAPPPAAQGDERERYARRFYGPSAAGLSGGEIRGAAGAPGRATGVARVVLDLGSASKLEPGDVLVTRTTSPAWTPLFAVAAAVVTDGGGALSHCAIVAREYGIPAVVGTVSATVEIADGQRIQVDGGRGVVRIVG